MEKNERYLHNELADKLIDEGRLMEGGFEIFQHYVIPIDATQSQINDMRTAWFAGAQHLFGSIMSVLDEDREPTEQDLKRMDSICKELEKFSKTFNL